MPRTASRSERQQRLLAEQPLPAAADTVTPTPRSAAASVTARMQGFEALDVAAAGEDSNMHRVHAILESAKPRAKRPP